MAVYDLRTKKEKRKNALGGAISAMGAIGGEKKEKSYAEDMSDKPDLGLKEKEDVKVANKDTDDKATGIADRFSTNMSEKKKKRKRAMASTSGYGTHLRARQADMNI